MKERGMKMKKAYVKPELFYEKFELSQHIAKCAWDLNSSDRNTCNTYVGDDEFGYGGYILLTEEQSCTLVFDDYCYQNNVQYAGTFNS